LTIAFYYHITTSNYHPGIVLFSPHLRPSLQNPKIHPH
jgi:hypothetical protein